MKDGGGDAVVDGPFADAAGGGTAGSGASGAGGSAGQGGQAGHAGAGGLAASGGSASGGAPVGGTDAGVDAMSIDTASGDAADAGLCAVDGTFCPTTDGEGVCCGGLCLHGTCCATSDCTKTDGGAGSVCVGHRCTTVANSLSGLLWQLPCKSSVSGTSCTTDATQMVSTKLTSNVPGTFNVTLRFRGVVEQKTYTGGCVEGTWVSGGSYTGDTYNIYKLTISSPAQTYFLNAGTSGITHTFAIDVTRTVLIDAGATVTLEANAVDGEEIKNIGVDGTTPVTVDVTSPTQPYDGQFIKMDIVDVALNPTSSALPATPGGSALKFAGAQYVLVPRSTSLEPKDVTVEAWTTFAGGAAGNYNSILGKAYGNSTADSYTMWFEGGALNAGTALTSPAGAVSVPWAPAADAWHHLAMTHDDTAKTTYLYVDGVLTTCTAATATPSYDEHPLYLGGDIDNGTLQGFWNGALDQLRIFSSARSAGQIWSDMHAHKLGPTNGLVAEWTFDEGSGQVVSDSSGNGAMGTLGATSSAEDGDPTWLSSGAP